MHNHEGHDLHHHHHEGLNEKNLLITVFLNFGITIAEIIGGLLSNSLALLSDALHNLSDAVSLLLAYLAYRFGKKPSSSKHTFGFKRVEILAALFNSVTLITICIYLFWEAYERLLNPEPIKGLLMLIVALIGLVANLIAVLLLHKDKSKNLNVKAAYLHLLGDTLSSVAVMIGGALIFFFDVTWLDPVLTILIGLYIIKETWSILRETIDILMQGVPSGVNIGAIRNDLEGIRGISNIHHVHVWSMDDSNIHFECHIDFIDDLKISETNIIREEISARLKDKHNINHVTVQAEYNCCDDKGLIHHSDPEHH